MLKQIQIFTRCPPVRSTSIPPFPPIFVRCQLSAEKPSPLSAHGSYNNYHTPGQHENPITCIRPHIDGHKVDPHSESTQNVLDTLPLSLWGNETTPLRPRHVSPRRWRRRAFVTGEFSVSGWKTEAFVPRKARRSDLEGWMDAGARRC